MPANRRRLAQSGSVVGAASALAFIFTTSARPRAFVLRALLSAPSPRSRARDAALADRVDSIFDEPYGDASDARLDVYFPASLGAGERRPAMIWVHGGAWISGRKEDAAHYFERLAATGLVVVAVEYTRAPDARYPLPVHQVNDAIAHVVRHADRFHVDESRLLLGGDSAGAQIVSQIATAVTSEPYAHELGITPAVDATQVRGCVLFGGVYDARAEARHEATLPNAALQLFIKSVLWAYTGDRERDSAVLREMSTIDHVTGAFPPTLISGGNGDPFTDVHSRPFATRLAELGVDVSTRFFPADYDTRLPHQYEFDLHRPDATATLDAVIDFAAQRVLTSAC